MPSFKKETLYNTLMALLLSGLSTACLLSSKVGVEIFASVILIALTIGLVAVFVADFKQTHKGNP